MYVCMYDMYGMYEYKCMCGMYVCVASSNSESGRGHCGLRTGEWLSGSGKTARRYCPADPDLHIVCMYVCINVCMYVCIYMPITVCMYIFECVCMYVSTF